jgi:acyl-CoA thioester hydrolase
MTDVRLRRCRKWAVIIGRVSPRHAAPEGEFHYRHPIEVRFVDTDALGHVNNATYLSYFEAARAGYYQALTGAPFGTGEGADRYTFLIAEASLHYRAPAFFGEPLVCECRIAWASRSSFGLEYRVRAEASPLGPARLVADGETVQVMYDLKAERVTRIPADLMERFVAYEGRPIPDRPARG